MNDNDLIRRGDVAAACQHPCVSCLDAIAALPAAPTFTAADLERAWEMGRDAAAGLIQQVADNWDCGHTERRLCDCGPHVEQWGFAAQEARAATLPADLAQRVKKGPAHD